MVFANNAMLVRRELLFRVCKAILNGNKNQEIDLIPYKIRPTGSISNRCCIHKERAVIRSKIISTLGFDEKNENETTSLSTFLKKGLNKPKAEEHNLIVVDEACGSCPKNNYVVTNFCQGCVARPCQVNCPKDAIYFENRQAKIDIDKCINCGKCMKACPFHAIIYQPRPCEEACPVDAIYRDEDHHQVIDVNKCISCGKCIIDCPFGAIISPSHLPFILRDISNHETVIAIVAPSIAGQFHVKFKNLIESILLAGFTSVVEVATGAETTAKKEGLELLERIDDNHKFMTTSCCTAYTNLVKKHLPNLSEYVSDTKTPMHYSAKNVKSKYPNCKIVFIGPCLAKKDEAFNDEFVDFVITYEELGSLFVAKDIDPSKVKGSDLAELSVNGRAFGITGGVTSAVKNYLSKEEYAKVTPEKINGIDKKSINMLKSYSKIKTKFNFLEVMVCDQGCIGGPGVLCTPAVASRTYQKFIDTLSNEPVVESISNDLV